MPAVVRAEPWEVVLRQQVRELARGWSVKEHRGRIRLRVRHEGRPEEAVTLEFAWASNAAGDAYTRIRNVLALVQQGHSLKAAAEVAAGRAPALTEDRDWHGAVQRFRDQKLHHGTAIKQVTWSGVYEPVLNSAVELLTGRKPPVDPAELIDRCIRDWPPGSRTRQQRARTLAQFLRYCVDRERFPAHWVPPASLKDHIGRKPADAISMAGDPVPDERIVELISSLPADQAGCRWGDALRLLAELGLRPIELLYLSVRTDPRTGEDHWFCTYQKRSGGGVTRPRRLYPLPLVGQEWNLLDRWKRGDIQLPPIREGKGAANSTLIYLNRQTGWCQLRDELEAEGLRLVPYSFRHSYSVRGHQRGIDSGSMALAMGHSLEVHCRSYPWATEVGAAAAFIRAAQIVATGGVGAACTDKA